MYNNGSKDTPIGPLPQDWDVAPLKNVVRFTSKPRNLQLPIEIPFIPMDLIPTGEIFINSYELLTNVSSGIYCEKGDILLPKITPSFENGKQGIVGNIPREFAFATTEVIPIQPSSSLDKIFLFFYLLHKPVRNDLAGKMEGTTGRQRIPKPVIESMLIPLPPISEQRTIAHVLKTMRKSIEATEKVIAAASELKRSLMKYLFTYGPVSTNQANQVSLKETEIGEVPEKWDVLQIGDIAYTTSGGTPSRERPEYYKGDIPWVKSGELMDTHIVKIEEFITNEAIANSNAKLFPKGTLLVAMYGATTGKVGILDIDATTNQAICAIFPTEVAISQYLFYALMHRRKELLGERFGGAQPNVNQRIIRAFILPIPPNIEQERIYLLLRIVDEKIDCEYQKKTALEGLFTSLLHNLMTGKLRTQADDVPAL